MTPLTPHFTLEELIHTEHRDIDNAPASLFLPAIQNTANGLELVEARVGGPIIISSGYRCPELNRAVGGQPNSDHTFGVAADCNRRGLTVTEFFLEVWKLREEIPFRQVIWEFGRWVHISFEYDLPGMSVIHPVNRFLVIRTRAEGYLPYAEGMSIDVAPGAGPGAV